jgi:16S rRNA (guanine527-N7)-methyltransferase
LNPAALAQLQRGAAELGVALDEKAVARLVAYAALLDKWNRVYNLTAIREEAKLVTHHLLDSLAVLPHLPAGRLLDVGSGGGLPGIPVAIVQPGRRVTLLDSNHKKGTFLRQAAMELELENVEVAVQRIEDHRPAQAYEIVISRAFSDLADFVNLAGSSAAAHGSLIAMKGVHPHEEIVRLPAAWIVNRVVELQVPQLDASRRLLFLNRQGESGENRP